MPSVRIPPVLRSDVGGNRTVVVEARTVRGALEALVADYPALDGRVLAEGELPPFINVFVDGEDARLAEGLDTAVSSDTTILLLPSVAGGGG